MKIHSESRIHHGLEAVFDAYRNHLSEVSPYLPDIKEIRVESREEADGVLKLTNRWVAQRDLPAVVSKVLKPEMMEWLDFAEWHDDGTYCEWRLELPAFPNRVRCAGQTRLSDAGDGGTRVLLTGNLDIDLKGFPGIPSLIARKAGPMVEEFIVKLITPNLEKTNLAVEKFLDSKG